MPELLGIFVSIQPWLDLSGLVMDFGGVVLLAAEWRIALSAERREAELMEQEERRRMPVHMRQHRGPHQDVFDDMNDRRKVREKLARGRLARLERSSKFTWALVLIGFGFLLQIAGSVPLV